LSFDDDRGEAKTRDLNAADPPSPAAANGASARRGDQSMPVILNNAV
jgi:hypothetical protein